MVEKLFSKKKESKAEAGIHFESAQGVPWQLALIPRRELIHQD